MKHVMSQKKYNSLEAPQQPTLKFYGKPGSQRALKNFVGRHLKIEVPDVQVCGHHAAPMDYLWYSYSRDFPWLRDRELKNRNGGGFAAAEMNRSLGCARDDNCGRDARVPSSGDCIVWANRAGGKTQLAAVATLLEGLFKRNCQTRILAGSLVPGRCPNCPKKTESMITRSIRCDIFL